MVWGRVVGELMMLRLGVRWVGSGLFYFFDEEGGDELSVGKILKVGVFGWIWLSVVELSRVSVMGYIGHLFEH